ncbi:hypothetical protein ABPG72_022590 [Tetrahymena utriculariae]
MLQKIKYETINYGRFDKLRKKFLSPDFEPEECKELELSHQHSKELPIAKCFEIVKNLSVLILSHNQIARFDPKILTKGAPQLEVLDLSHNKIEILDDIVDLGTLVHLKILEFSNNPLCNHISRINTIIELFFPEKYKKYDPVKILTASYQQHPPTRLSLDEEEQMKKDLQVFYKFNEELEAHETRKSVSKYSHRNTLAKYAVEPCPVPRKSRFKNLEYLNGQIITKLDMMRASGKDKIKDIVEDENEQHNQFKKMPRQNEELHKKYLEKYIKKIIKMNEDNMATNVRNIKQSGDGTGGEEDLKYLSKVDEALSRGAASTIDPRKYAADIWNKPLDLLYKDATFSISMKEYKQMLKDYDVEKKKKEEKQKQIQSEKRKSRRTRVLKKLLKAGIQPVTEEEMKQLEDDSDPDGDNLFKSKRGKPRLKFDLNKLEEKQYSSSESEQSERLYQRELSSFSINSPRDIKDFEDFNQEDDGVTFQESMAQEEERKQKKKQNYQQQSADVDVLELKKRLDNTKAKNQALIQKKPFQINAAQKKPQKKEEEKKTFKYTSPPQDKVDNLTTQQDNETKKDQSQNTENLIQTSQFQDDLSKQTNEKMNQASQQNFTHPGIEAVPVSRYEFIHNKNTEQVNKEALNSYIKNQTHSTFKVANKIFSNHNKEREQQQKLFYANAEGRVGSSNIFKKKRDRSSSSSLSESENKQAEKNTTGKKYLSKQSTAYKSTGALSTVQKSQSTQKQNTITATRSNQRLQSQPSLQPNKFKEEKKVYKCDIPPDQLVPTVEQGLDEHLRNAALYNPDNEMYHKIQRFKQNLENCNVLQAQIQELDKKVGPNLYKKKPVSQFVQTINYDEAFKYLKDTVKDFKVMHSHDLANHLEYKVMRKKVDPMSKKKMSTFELYTIINKVNDYDKKMGPKLKEKDINEKLSQPPSNLDFDERNQMYNALEILEEIKLKKMKISKEHLRRIEKKEIERAEHDARLAYHYYKLRNHIDDGNLEKYLKRLNIGLDGKNDQGKIQFKKKMGKKNDSQNFALMYDETNVPQYYNRNKNLSEGDKKKDKKGFVGHYEELMKQKKEIIEPREIPEVNLTGFILEKYPDINEWANSRLYVPQPKLTFEDLMEQNDRKIKDEFQKSRNNKVLSIEEQMMKYAQEFKEKEQQRDELRKRIEGYVKNGTKILDEFLKQEMFEIDKRYDLNHCMNEYIKLMREDKLPKRIPASQIKKNIQ